MGSPPAFEAIAEAHKKKKRQYHFREVDGERNCDRLATNDCKFLQNFSRKFSEKIDES